MEFSVPALANQITTEADAYLFLEGLRWGKDKVLCPHCGSERAYYLTPKNGMRQTRHGTGTQRRVWKCASCRKQFSVLTGTIFHGSHIPVRTWVFVIFEMCSSKNGVAAREIERKFALTNKTAWFMLHRIREAMRREPLAGMLSGTVIADETWIGGKPANRHSHQRGRGGQGSTDKTPVVSLIDKATGEVRSKVLPKVSGKTLRRALMDEVDLPATVLHTDQSNPYRAVAPLLGGHETVNHNLGEYVRGDVTTNAAEGYFSQLKRSIDGTHHHVSIEHLPRYLDQFDYLYSTRKMTDTARTRRLVGQVAGRRLSYRPATER